MVEILDQEIHKTWDKIVGWYKMTMKYFNTHFVDNFQVKGCIETCLKLHNNIEVTYQNKFNEVLWN